MIAGRITPPGCHLSAIEILRRQYFAHLLDLAAHGRLPNSDGTALSALPSKATDLFGTDYLTDLADAAVGNADFLVGEFLALFPTDVTDEAVQDLRDFAARGLRSAIGTAKNEWFRTDEVLHQRLRMIKETRDELHDSDPEHVRQKAELGADERAVRQSQGERSRIDSQSALCDLGLLPNYALLDTVTTLNATLYWEESNPDGGPRFQSASRTYERPRRYALHELAPGNAFYVNGYKHEISGIEIGTRESKEWQSWRFCPDCGYVRIGDEQAKDRSPCLRCGRTGIADDGSCLHQVVEPKLVTSRDRREDARISDDRDDRDREFYTVIDAVDIDRDAIEPRTSWRHKTVTFGVDFCRTTMIRRINVGPARFDRRDDDMLAGQPVRISPFYICTDCGAASADGVPVIQHDPDALSSSVRDHRVQHHRPWCRLRRSGRRDAVHQQPVLLAHELRTEALRVLLPASTMLVAERVHSFRATLRLGVDRHYGGDPQHLDTTLATMPDTETGERRHFLVLFDRLPGGTGYLHRLVKPTDFQQTLIKAREALLNCPCAQEGRRACHRCLHQHTEERFQDVVSRQDALEILGELLGSVDENGDVVEDKWATDPVDSTAVIGLERQLESDLEARFLAVLRRWAAAEDSVTLDEDSRASGYLRFATTSDVVSWRLTLQRRTGYTRTDFTFERVDGPRQVVTVYLDGYRNHAVPHRNRIAGDAEKRTRLRSDGHVVFQLTWSDLDLFENTEHRPEPVWPPYSARHQDEARDVYEELGGNRTDLARTIFVNPVRTVLEFLRAPDRDAWAGRAKAMLYGLIKLSQPIVWDTDHSSALAAVRAELTDANTSTPDANGSFHVLRGTDTHGADILFVVDEKDGTYDASRWAALAIHDDSDAALDDPRHRLRWRAWLYWSNLIQFLDFAGGDGIQLASSGIAMFAPETLTVFSAADAEEQPDTERVKDPLWHQEILSLLEEDEPDSPLTRLARLLASRGKRVPVFGYELGEQGWQTDFGWSAVQVAVIGSEQHDHDAVKRDEAYAAAGWQVHSATYWLEHIDSLLELIPDAEGSAAE